MTLSTQARGSYGTNVAWSLAHRTYVSARFFLIPKMFSQRFGVASPLTTSEWFDLVGVSVTHKLVGGRLYRCVFSPSISHVCTMPLSLIVEGSRLREHKGTPQNGSPLVWCVYGLFSKLSPDCGRTVLLCGLVRVFSFPWSSFCCLRSLLLCVNV